MTAKYQDYYQSLGVSRGASEDDIKRAFRKLAREFHPDVNKAPSAEARFKEINEAYEVLSDPEKRKLYDQLGANWKAGQDFRPPPGWHPGASGRPRGAPGGAGPDAGGGAADFSEFFESLFGGMGDMGGGGFGGFSGDDFAEAMRGSRGRAGRARSRQGETHEAEVTVPLSDAYRGGTRQITLETTDARGRSSSKTYDVRIPAGTTDGSVIRLSGQGGAGAGGGPSGDLLLRIRIAPDPRFRLDQDSRHDLHTVVPLAPWEAVLGAKVNVASLDGDLTLTVPAGAQSGQKLRIRGHGLPKKGGERGDLYAELRVVVPKSPLPDEKALYEQLARVSNFDPRSP